MKKIGVVIILVIVYILLINVVARIDFSILNDAVNNNVSSNNSFVIIMGGNEIATGFSDSVSTSVLRKRFYGRIEEHGANSYVYLFNLVKLPIQTYGVYYGYFHYLFSAILLTVFLRE